MYLIKTLTKYILGQFLFWFKSLFVSNNINFKELKTLFITFSNKDSVYNRFVKLSFSDFIFIINRKEEKEFTVDYEKRKVIFDFKLFPQTNAELIIFDSTSITRINEVVFKPNYIYIPINSVLFNFNSILRFCFKNKYFFTGFRFWNGLGFIYEKRNKNNTKTSRRFIPFQYSRIKFLNLLLKKNISNVILRWFDELENLNDPFEDIDILIDTKYMAIFNDLISNEIGILPIDVYSTAGENEASYANLPYFPPSLSEAIVSNKIVHKNEFYIPNNEYYLISLVYHIVFHKSLKSGLKIDVNDLDTEESKRNYIKILEKLFRVNNIKFQEITLKSLYDFIEEQNYLPEYDLMLKLQNLKQDKWYATIISKARGKYLQDYNYIEGLSVFLLREKAVNQYNIDLVLKYLKLYGFDILENGFIEGLSVKEVRENIRGGKWDKGPFEVNAGAPKYYFLVFDSFSKIPTGKYKVLYPNLENEKAIKLKLNLRYLINLNRKESLNSLHTSDDFYESIYYLKQIGYNKSEIKKIIGRCKELNIKYDSGYKVEQVLSRFAIRAKLELIDFNGVKAVKKTYRQNKLDYLERERWLLSELKDTGLVPGILKSEENYIIIEYFEDAIILGETNKALNVKNIIQLRTFFEILYEKNITILDANASNLLIDTENNIKIIDFEYAQNYRELPIKVTEIYELGKIPLDKVGVYPLGHENIKDAYSEFWKYRIYLTKNQFFKLRNSYLIKVAVLVNKLIFSIERNIYKIAKRGFKMFRREYTRVLKEFK